MFNIYQCQNKQCRFRFPDKATNTNDILCPKCKSETNIVEDQFDNQKILHDNYQNSFPKLVVVLDNIRSIYNVGSMMRTGDGAGVSHFYLSGITATPENHKLKKTGLGAENQTNWSYHLNALDLVNRLKTQGCTIWALEGGNDTLSIFDLPKENLLSAPIALVIGNEISGVDPGILRVSDQVISIPMQGFKDSLNVAIAFGIAVYAIRYSGYK